MKMFASALVIAGGLLSVSAVPVRAEIEIVPVTSPGGITAWLYEDHSIPILSIEANFRGGTALDPEGMEGAVTLMTGLLEEGTGDMDATAFAQATESVAARFGYDAHLDSVSISAEVLTEFRDESLDLLRRAMVEPSFDQSAFDRVRAQIVSMRRSDQTDPDSIAREAFYVMAFDDHAYARPKEGTLESLAALDVETIRQAHRDALVKDRLKVSVVGDITEEELGPLLDDLFGDLPQSGPERPDMAEVKLDGEMRVIDLNIPQSVVVFGHEGIFRDDPDFIPAFVLDQILGGGGFGSRLTEEVREKRGLTYGIYSYLAPSDFAGLYIGSFSSANGVVGEAVDIVKQEWAKMAEEGVTEQELEDANRYLTGAYPLRFDSNASIAGQLLGLQIADLGLDYVNQRNAMVEAVTVEDIKRVAARVLQPEELSWVIVGRPEGLNATN
ncbi:M16 family metallopeptidase [Amaricoccus tamworthensis]|uniref:M16 family metallopeptidase n=1 Tax=Amaricoccus tamworthensis TaxID=57002 RepID=UPI003C7E3797